MKYPSLFIANGSTTGQLASGTVVVSRNGSTRLLGFEGGNGWFIEAGNTNKLLNPSIESTTISEYVVQGTGTVGRSTVTALLGTASLHVITWGAAASGVSTNKNYLTATPGSTYTFSAYAKGTGTVRIRLFSVRADGVTGAGDDTYSGNTTLSPGGWTRITHTLTTANALTAFICARVEVSTAAASDYYLDALQLESGAVATSYTDGSRGTGYAWTGTANQSASTRATGTLSFPLASFASMYIRYGEGLSVYSAHLTGAGSFGTSGTVAHSAGTVTISSISGMTVGPILFYSTLLTADEIDLLDSTPTAELNWDTLVSWPATIGSTGSGGSIAIATNYYRSNLSGKRLEEIDADVIIGGSLSLNQDAVRSPWTLTCQTTDAYAFQRYIDYIIPELSITGPDGVEELYQLGHYRVTQTPRSHASSGSTGRIIAEDLTAVLGRYQMTSNTAVPATSNVTTYTEGVLTGLGFSAAQIAIPVIAKTPSADSIYYAGDSWLTLLNGMLQSVGYRSLYMDHNGLLTTSESTELTSQASSVTYTNPQVIGTVEEDDDDSRLRNVVTVRRITPGLPQIHQTASNLDQSSPLYLYGPVGQLAGPPIDDPQIADEATALARARSELSYGASFYNRATVAVVPDTSIDLFRAVELDIRDDEGNQQLSGVWWRRTIDIDLGPGVSGMAGGMKMNVNRVVPFQITGGLS
jgi:hypothetical protein